MSKTKQLRSSSEIRDEIQSIEPHLRRARSILIGARLAASEVTTQIVNGSIHSHAENLDQPDTGRHLDLGRTLTEAAGLTYFVHALEQDETVIEAMEKLQPLFDELAAAIERETAEQVATRAAWQERENRKAEALAAATAAIELEFATA